MYDGIDLVVIDCLICRHGVVLFAKGCKIKHCMAATGYRYGLSNHTECHAH